MRNQKTVTEDFGTTHCSVAAPLTFGSLFAGIGGFDLGFERAGMVCKWQVEIDDYANRVLAKHWPSVHRERDIRETGPHNLEYVDVICGGFPCQDISYAGLGAGLDGARSGLFFEAIRLVRELRPQFVVLENVAALLTRGLDRVLGTLAEIGFDAEWHCIPAAAVGAPHIRDRVFVLGHANGGRRTPREPAGATARHRIPTSAASDDASSMANAKSTRRKTRRSNSNANGVEACIERASEFSGSGPSPDANGEGLEKRKREDTSGAWTFCGAKPCRSEWWQFEPGVGRVANGIPRRVDRLRGLGNAVVPQVAEHIGRCIVAASENVA